MRNASRRLFYIDSILYGVLLALGGQAVCAAAPAAARMPALLAQNAAKPAAPEPADPERPALEARLRAFRALKAGNIGEAEGALTEALRQMPGQPVLLVAKGGLLEVKRDFKGAIAAYDEAIQVTSRKPDFNLAMLYYRRAQMRLNLGDSAAALADMDSYISNYAEKNLGLLYRGMLAFAAGKRKEAADNMQTAMVAARPPFSPDPLTSIEGLLALGRVNLTLGAFDESLGYYRELGDAALQSSAFGVWGPEALAWAFAAQARASGKPPSVQARKKLEQELATFRPEFRRGDQIARLFLQPGSPDPLMKDAPRYSLSSDLPCEQAAVLGEWHLLYGRRAEAKPHLSRAVELCAPANSYRALAAAELQRLEHPQKR